MAYNKTTWVNDETPLNADNMNNIEDGISQNELDILTLEGSKQDKLTSGTNIKTINNESVLGTGDIELGLPTLSGTTAPTTSTVGSVGQFYLDTVTTKLYKCDAVTTVSDVTTYTWTEVGGSAPIYLHITTFQVFAANVFVTAYIYSKTKSTAYTTINEIATDMISVYGQAVGIPCSVKFQGSQYPIGGTIYANSNIVTLNSRSLRFASSSITINNSSQSIITDVTAPSYMPSLTFDNDVVVQL